MDRISTSQTYQSALLGIMQAQQKLTTAQQQVSSGYIGSDYKAYASNADTLTAMKTMDSRLSAYSDAVSSVSDKLAQQDQALTAVNDASGGASQAVMNAIAAGDGGTLMPTLQGWYSQAVDALNTTYGGQYLFSGGQTQTPPVASDQMSALTTPVSSMFANDQTKATSRISDNISVTTGVLASDVGSPLFSALQQIQAYNASANGPFGSPLTSAQNTFLTGVLTTLKSAQTGTTAQVALNAVNQERVDNASSQLSDRKTAVEGIVGKLSDADPAKAATDLSLAQTALQASAQVFSTLNSSSLLNVLSTTS